MQLREQTDSKQMLVAAWPGPQDYNEAVQNPRFSFLDPELADGVPETDALGLPKPTSGMFASVYKMQCQERSWAVRCILQSKQDIVERYQEIHKTLEKLQLACTVKFEFQEEGIRVDNRILPMLKMEWCEGLTLNRWLQENLKKKDELESFLESWRESVLLLREHGIAHGDMQHGNIIVKDGKIKLVDYDGMFLPAFAGKQSNEIGHPNYQHPQRTQYHFGAYLDNFSAWLIYLSVLISGCDPHVWHDFDGGDECLLFRREDLEDPQQSELFHVLEHHFNPQIREASRTLRYLLSLAPDQIPSLDQPIQVPDDLPVLDGVISDLPEWIQNQNDGSLSLPTGKRFLKRRRQRGVPLPAEQKMGAISGCWKYDETGLAFNPQENENSLSNSTGGNVSASLVTSSKAPVPYRNINGTLHSPFLSPSYENYDNNRFDFSDLKFLVKPAIILFTIVIFLGINVSKNAPKFEYWPDDQYYSLTEGLKLEENGEAEKARNMFKSGITQLQKSKDPRSEMSRVRLYYNLGRVDNALADAQPAVSALLTAEALLKKVEGGVNSVEYSDVLIELGKAYETLLDYPTAERWYKKAIESMSQVGIATSDSGYQDVLESLIKILRFQNKIDDATSYEALLTSHAEAPSVTPQQETTNLEKPKSPSNSSAKDGAKSKKT